MALRNRPALLDALGVFVPGLVLFVLTRAPLVASDRFFADGDEAIVGLMAKHLLERGEGALFYWGQAYGVAVFEAAAGALAFALGGISGPTLKLGALAVFLGGWIAFVAAARRLAGDRVATFTGVLLASTPSWFAFSAKAWGGFVTSFALASVALLVLAAPLDRPRRTRALVAGGLGALTFFSQAITALAFAPLFLSSSIRPTRRSEWTALAGGAMLLGGALLAAARPGEAYWAPSLFRGFAADDADAVSAPSIARAMTVMATGCHFMSTALPAPTFARVAAGLALLTLAALLATAAVRVARTRSFPVDAACAASILLVFAVALAMRPDRLMFRYLLPAVAPLTLGVSVLAVRCSSAGARRRLGVVLGAILWAIAGVAAAISMRSLPFSGWSWREERALPVLVTMLEREGVRAVYVTHPTFQWSLMFESHERVLARWTQPRDRRPEIPRAVDAALASGEKVALVAMPREGRAVAAQLEQAGPALEPRFVRDAFVVFLGVNAAQLESVGFRFADVRSGTPPSAP